MGHTRDGEEGERSPLRGCRGRPRGIVGETRGLVPGRGAGGWVRLPRLPALGRAGPGAGLRARRRRSPALGEAGADGRGAGGGAGPGLGRLPAGGAARHEPRLRAAHPAEPDRQVEWTQPVAWSMRGLARAAPAPSQIPAAQSSSASSMRPTAARSPRSLYTRMTAPRR
ncbi:UPF0561 protein C2orf68 homolog isoform X4 [Chelonia mydas]|uniref:UPF0561 protein C2orf68 homolog isoform X4 n=1 Tax=Chelonia mydas TaxID=8469 RepID=UPI001CA90A38|nr:UPF0561 protein C2orf68 homolog isoform X4 [Chelonia mydas]